MPVHIQYCINRRVGIGQSLSLHSLLALQRVLLLHMGFVSIATWAVGTKETQWHAGHSAHTHTCMHANTRACTPTHACTLGAHSNTDLLLENALSTEQALMLHSELKFHLWKNFYSAHNNNNNSPRCKQSTGIPNLHSKQPTFRDADLQGERLALWKFN